jgi:competence protein ComEC
MLARALLSLPSARLVAGALLASASVLHFGGRLPSRGWLMPMMIALAALPLLGWIAWRRQATLPQPAGAAWLPHLVTALRVAMALLLVCSLLLWRIHDALESRLPAALEGRDLEVTGIVDGMPQRFEFGDRVKFSLASCGLALAGASSACGRLERVQLDWGPVREKDRAFATPAQEAHAPHEAEDAAQTDDDAAAAAAGSAEPPEDGLWPQPGQYWRLVVRLKRPVAPVNPGGFDLELRYLQQGVGALGRVHARQRLARAPPGLGWRPAAAVVVAFESWRTRLRDRLEAVYAHRVDPPGAGRAPRWPLLGIVSGLALGDQGAIGAGLWGLFSRTGVSHLMAISGMHVTMLALVAAWLAAKALTGMARRRHALALAAQRRCPRQVLVLGVAVLVAFAYALLSGWGIPSQRTCWMLAAAALMSLSGRGRGALDITLMAAAVVIAVDPWAVSTAGFWLSFGAVAAILWCAHGQDSRQVLRMTFLGIGSTAVPAAVRDAFTSQWAATLGLAPLVVALFSTFSLIGPVANAVAIPWVSFLVTPLAVAAALLAPLSEPACAFILQANLWMIEHLVDLLGLLDRLPAASVAIARPAFWTLLAALAGSVVLIAPPGFPMRPAGLLCLLPMLLAEPRLPTREELWITALDIGHGSSILVESGQHRLLFDAGPGRGVDTSAAARFLVPYLRSRGIEAIDTLVVSHLDVEHAGGAGAVLQALRPTRLVTSFDARLLQVAPGALERADHLPCTAGRRLQLGMAVVEFLHPPAVAGLRKEAQENDSSCVLRIQAAAGSVVLAGDLSATMEASLVAGALTRAGADRSSAGALRSDVLIVPQQGGRNASGALLLAAVQPAVAVLQVGYRNRHRHPHPTVLGRLAGSGAEVLRTDQDGAVQVRLRAGARPQVSRLRRDAPPYWRIGGAAGEVNGAAGEATAPSSRRR